ncbi:DUF523 domain-containing protein [Actinorugispora endophytica]|uniref:Uncharacterized protein YbbK (DUF523 family) n=1 Tax=Actinorugispora endophytica TaxID=1605990 RepID=A0A4R6V4L2_9ACTN|nr:DUF523 domain-containing protein [Actinorugispora endophytica]TDQ53217.1 uncharacterized protein YbbK (DUF523 family) [Actinorugispora endophytica]
MERILVSACLMGRAVRYDGGAKPSGHAVFLRWREEGRLVPFCPEVAGGLPVPRPPAEIEGARGARAVLEGEARIRTPEGADVTEFFLAGARAALRRARDHGVRLALLKEGSPSCGVHRIYDGTFTGAKTPGAGVTTLLLQDHGIDVFTENELPQARARLAELESAPR